MYAACKEVKWEDKIRYMYGTANDFCNDVLHLNVSVVQFQDLEGAFTGGVPFTERPTNKFMRICTPNSREHEAYCLGPEVHSTLGLACALLCVFICIGSRCSELIDKLPFYTRWCPAASVSLCFGVLLEIIVKEILAPWELSSTGTHHLLDFVAFDTEIFGFLLLPVIIFRCPPPSNSCCPTCGY